MHHRSIFWKKTMKLLLLCLLASTSCYFCSAFSPYCSFRLERTCLSLDSSSSADSLLKVVEDLSKEQVIGESIPKMEELEKVLSTFLEEARNSTAQTQPRPPAVPPPLAALGISTDTNLEGELSLANAEMALQKLRQRLQKEEESLRGAEESLMKSFEEEKVLQRAEMVLQQSRKAAEKRKAEAIRRTEAAVISTEKARQSQKEAEDTAASIVQKGQDRATRSTVSIASLTNANKERNAVDDSGDKLQYTTREAAGIPTLYNWSQDNYGSITGRVKGSEMFMDGNTVSTSPVPMGVKGGVIVTTTSGSKYYLQKEIDSKIDSAQPAPIPTNISDESSKTEAETILSKSSSMHATAPVAVPSIRNWGLLEYGGISGLLFGSPNAEDGDYIETSPIATGSIENGSVVTTGSGSQYFLCPRKSPAKVPDKKNAEIGATSVQRGGTITINKVMTEKKTNNATRQARQQKPRPTFSLSNLGFLFGASNKSSTKKAPGGIPTLTGWTIDDDGTVTGVISGSRGIDDGDIVTTSPIVDGRKERFETVTTISGSVYFLG